MAFVLTVLQKGGENVSIQWEMVNIFPRGVFHNTDTMMTKTEWILFCFFFRSVKAIKKNCNLGLNLTKQNILCQPLSEH